MKLNNNPIKLVYKISFYKNLYRQTPILMQTYETYKLACDKISMATKVNFEQHIAVHK